MNPGVAGIEPVGTISDIQTQAATVAPSQPSGRFADWFDNQVGQLNTQLVHAEQGVQQLAAGDAASLHDVMIRMEEARLSFQLAVQFRSRVLEAYQDVMRMQV